MNLISFYAIIFATGLFLLGILFFYTSKRSTLHYTGQHIFRVMLICVAAIMFVDFVAWTLNSPNTAHMATLHKGVIFVYYILTPLPGLIWSCYTDYKIFKDYKRIKRQVLFLLIPVAVNTLFSVISLFNSCLFSINSQSGYNRGPLFAITVICTYVYILQTSILLLLHRKHMTKNDFVPLLVFGFLPTVCGLIQIIFKGADILWIGITLSLFIAYICGQNEIMQTDYLTGLYNRFQLEQYLYIQFSRKKSSDYIIGFMLDLNKFKKINDEFGHAVGDEALIDAGSIIVKAFPKEAFISRYAGDEFVVVVSSPVEDVTDFLKKRIKAEEEAFNKTSGAPYKLSFSIGAISCPPDNKNDVAQFLLEIDKKMYEDKQRRHAEIV